MSVPWMLRVLKVTCTPFRPGWWWSREFCSTSRTMFVNTLELKCFCPGLVPYSAPPSFGGNLQWGGWL